jgi:hypothetical protein
MLPLAGNSSTNCGTSWRHASGRCHDRGWFHNQGRQLPCNDTVSSRCMSVAPHNPTAPPQPASEGSSSGKVVDFPRLAWSVCALMDGGATHRSWALLESDNSHFRAIQSNGSPTTSICCGWEILGCMTTPTRVPNCRCGSQAMLNGP